MNNLLQWRTVVGLIKNGLIIASSKIFNRYVDHVKKTPQYVHFRCEVLHNKNFLEKYGRSYKLQESLHKQELEHDEIFQDNWEEKENEWLP